MRGHISNHWLRLLFNFLEQRDHDAEAILAVPCPEATELGRLSADQWREHLERAAQATNNPALGLDLGRSIRLQQLGILGYAASAAETLLDALNRLKQFDRLVYQIDPMQMHVSGDLAILEWHTRTGDPGQMVDETAIASLVSCTTQLLGDDRPHHPSAVRFVNPPTSHMDSYIETFGCEPAFEAATTQVQFPVQWLSSKVAQSDPALLDILDRQAASLLRQIPGEDSFEHELRRAITNAIASGDPSLARIARSMTMSSRSLQRRLAERRLNFQKILDDARAQLADRYLRDQSLPLSEVSLLLGYSEQSAFTRAYKRWTGQAPLSRRQQINQQITAARPPDDYAVAPPDKVEQS